MKLYTIEGNRQRLDGGAMFGNAPRPVWEKWYPPDEKNRIELACRGLLLVTDDGRKILIETGIGNFFDPKLKERFGVIEEEAVLLKSLKTLGFEPSDIDIVILSHLHFDHAGGMLVSHDEGANALVFPDAKIYVGESHWERAKNPHPRDRASFLPELHELLEASGNLVLVPDSGASDLAPLITFRFSSGHTPGLMLPVIQHPQGNVIFCADLIPGMAWVHVPITMGYDRYPELGIEEKKALLAEFAQNKGYLFFTHDKDVPLATVRQDEKGRYRGEPTGELLENA